MSFSALFGGIVFSAVGLIGWKIGRSRNSIPKMVIGVALMGFTFVVPGDLWILIVADPEGVVIGLVGPRNA